MNFNSIRGAWKYGVDAVMHRGNTVKDERGDWTKELQNLVLTVDKPLIPTKQFGVIQYEVNDPVTTGLWSNENTLDLYIEEFLAPENSGFVYTYGERLHGHFNMPKGQVDNAIDRLNDCRSTRRAVCVTYDPSSDYNEPDIPCLILVDFKVRNGCLNTTGVWRSHDIAQAYYPNVVGLSYLAKKVAVQVGVDMGSITTHSISAHIRETDFDYARSIL